MKGVEVVEAVEAVKAGKLGELVVCCLLSIIRCPLTDERIGVLT